MLRGLASSGIFRSRGASCVRIHAGGVRNAAIGRYPAHWNSSRLVSSRGFFQSTVSARAVEDADVIPPPIKEDVKKSKDVEEAPIEATETIIGEESKHEFQAETRKLLDIVAQSLYTDKEVFVRELISNASDALEKCRHKQLTGDITDEYLDLEMHIATDEKAKQLIIQDFGIGMTKEELVENIGTIAHSGTGAYLKQLGDSTPDAQNLIGQFGVGFYSVFMVADKVTIYTRSAEVGSKGYVWTSDGSGSFSIAEADGVSRGTKIVIQLKKGNEEFSRRQNIKNIITKYSNFVPFNIKLNGDKVNKIKAIWSLPKSQVTEQDHKEFYQLVAGAYDEPRFTLHFTSDSPLSIQSIFYVPDAHQEKHGMGKMPTGVSLYSRKVLIQSKAQGIMPEWLRFVKGVVDCEDISLNLSREHMQDNVVIQRLGNVVTGRILKFLQERARKDPSAFNEFWHEYNMFIKEGIATDFKWKEDLGQLFRFESSAVGAGELTSLDGYIDRMPQDQMEIYYLCCPSRANAESSPYFESFDSAGTEVMFLYAPVDDVIMTNLGTYRGKKLTSVEIAKPTTPTKSASDEADSAMSKKEVERFTEWLKGTLSSHVSSVKESTRLSKSPAVIVDHYESASFRRMMRSMDGKAPPLPKQRLEINPTHPVIQGLNGVRKGGDAALAKMVAEQVLDDALVAAGLLDDARTMLPRLNKILAVAVGASPSGGAHGDGVAPQGEDVKAANDEEANPPEAEQIVPEAEEEKK